LASAAKDRGVIVSLLAAASLACQPPVDLPRPRPDLPSAEQPRRRLSIGSYTLALIWSPETCRGKAGNADAIDCRIARGFVLHGLWPDGRGRDWPQYCASATLLPQATIRANYCVTPSVQLLQHEWAKHGTCMAGYSPQRYFGQATRLFARLQPPAMDALAARRDLTVRSFSAMYERANRLPSGSVRLNLSRSGWLREVWLCLDRRFQAHRCPVTQGGADSKRRLRIHAER
jgi:ribonuclease T2